MGRDESKRTRRKFSEEFKENAVALVRETDRSIAEVADELGIYDSTLGNWVRKAEAAEVDGRDLTVDERARLKRLEAENAELRVERDLLKRTVAFWVKESTP